MSTQAERVLQLLRARGVEKRKIRPELARVSKASYQSVYQWEIGETKTIKAQYLSRIARHWGASLDWLTDGTGSMDGRPSESVKPESDNHSQGVENVWPLGNGQSRRLPIISWKAAGMLDDDMKPEDTGEVLGWQISPFGGSDGDFLFLVEGDMMQPAYQHGDIAHVVRGADPGHGQDAIVRLPDGRTVLRRYRTGPDGAYLEALNPAWPDRIIAMPEGATIIGRVAGAWRAAP